MLFNYILILFDNLMSTGINLTEMINGASDGINRLYMSLLIRSIHQSNDESLKIIFSLAFYIPGCVATIKHNHLPIFLYLLNRVMSIKHSTQRQDVFDVLLTIACEHQRKTFCEFLSVYNLTCHNTVHCH